MFRGQLIDEQVDVFRHVLDGKTSIQIAALLGCAPEHVDRVVRRTCRQLNVSGRKQAALAIATHLGWDVPSASRRRVVQEIASFSAGSIPTEMERTEREQRELPRYLGSAGKRTSRPGATRPADEIEAVHDWRVLLAHPIYGRVLLLAMVIAASALALSTLVSALLGFERLVSS